MTSDSTPPAPASAAEPARRAPMAGSERPPDFADLSRRIGRRATDLIAIGLIAITGLVVARRLIVWWKTDPQAVAASATGAFSPGSLAPWGAGPEGADIGFENAGFVLNRQSIEGSSDDAFRRLQYNCRRILASEFAAHNTVAPGENERELLARLAILDPVESDPLKGWAIYRLEGPLAMILGIVDVPHGAGKERRVLCWGLAFPASESIWTLLTVQPERGRSAAATELQPQIPPGAVAGMSVSDQSGGRLITFRKLSSPEAARAHFQQLARAHGWTPLRPWRTDRDSASAAWSVPGSRPQRVDVHLTPSEQGWNGLLHVSPQLQSSVAAPQDTQP